MRKFGLFFFLQWILFLTAPQALAVILVYGAKGEMTVYQVKDNTLIIKQCAPRTLRQDILSERGCELKDNTSAVKFPASDYSSIMRVAAAELLKSAEGSTHKKFLRAVTVSDEEQSAHQKIAAEVLFRQSRLSTLKKENPTLNCEEELQALQQKHQNLLLWIEEVASSKKKFWGLIQELYRSISAPTLNEKDIFILRQSNHDLKIQLLLKMLTSSLSERDLATPKVVNFASEKDIYEMIEKYSNFTTSTHGGKEILNDEDSVKIKEMVAFFETEADKYFDIATQPQAELAAIDLYGLALDAARRGYFSRSDREIYYLADREERVLALETKKQALILAARQDPLQEALSKSRRYEVRDFISQTQFMAEADDAYIQQIVGELEAHGDLQASYAKFHEARVLYEQAQEVASRYYPYYYEGSWFFKSAQSETVVARIQKKIESLD